ncbi:hypothetical protein C8N46_101179 [Kordia periserrulae]|uniref:Uncharacterized protein n=1 Tax=Kordia periserrulae TaxID=701523 RepID=A0A2T6C5H0_9FLAO|nr:hypothetical protein [Kordia periserrulae]PTX63578.1 hypothetical protein C8N46_101179 [Kordia periserrulae]
MKCIQITNKLIIMMMAFFFCIQSCTIYRNASATLDEAVASERKVKVHLQSGVKKKYKKVIKSGETYYGIVWKDTLQIDQSEIVRIQLKNPTLSTIGTVFGAGIGALGLLVGIVALALVSI